jgi:phosphate/sulfate permease
MKTVRIDLIKKMALNWVLAPSIAFLSCFILIRILQ